MMLMLMMGIAIATAIAMDKEIMPGDSMSYAMPSTKRHCNCTHNAQS